MSLPLLAAVTSFAAIERMEITFERVRAMAAERAAQPYRTGSAELPKGLADLTRIEELGIRFRPGQEIWGNSGLPFCLELIHRGPLRPDMMEINEFSPTHVQTIPFSKAFFDYADVDRLGWLRSSLNYAGVKVKATIHRPDRLDDWVVFLAGSWRSIGQGQSPGVWSRGLVVDAGVSGLTEEVARFTDVWLAKPDPGTRVLTAYALLDAPSVTGAYQLIIDPGRNTVADIRGELHFRKPVTVIGIAPLVSSFWFGENTSRPSGVLWPERHDSDGLWVQLQGQAPFWRPLGNPAGVQRSQLPADKLERFGLMQRDRDPAHYQDLGTAYETKPSVWVEPTGEWGPGAIRLIEFPNPQGTDRNIMAFWVPSLPIDYSKPFAFSYRISWGEPPAPAGTLAKVAGTRVGVPPALEGDDPARRARLFWVDFQGKAAAALPEAEVSVQLDARNGRIVGHRLLRNPSLPGWRVEIEAEAAPDARLVELSCQLRRGYEVLSESWNSPWIP